MIRKDTKIIIDGFYGEQSPLNLLGKILLSPIMLSAFIIWVTLDTLFLKKEDK